MNNAELVEDSTYFYLLMESERQKIPNMTRESYIPIFIVNTLREKLETGSHKIVGCQNDVYESDEDDIRLLDDDIIMKETGPRKGNVLLSHEELRKSIHNILRFAEDACSTFQIDKAKFRECFINGIEFPCLELLWLLDIKYHLQEITSYLMHLQRKTQVDHFIMQLMSLCFYSSSYATKTKSMTTQMLYDFMEALFIASFCNPLKTQLLIDLQSRANEILFRISSRILEDDDQSQQNNSYLANQFLMAVIQEVPVSDSVKVRYLSQQLSLHLNYADENIVPKYSAKDILQYQEKFAEPSESQKNTFFAMLTEPPQSCQEVVQLLEKSLSRAVVQWENVLIVMTEWIKRREYEAISLVREMIKRLMKTGLSTESEQDVITAFILARHCSLVAPREFLRYEKWYTNMFESDVYSPAKDPEAFNFLTNLLSEWIPLEPPCFLRVHATFWPYVPPGCRNLFSDYVSLAKVRIAEYNEVETAMEFEPNPNNPLQHDVEMAIKTYDSTKKTPQSIGQMWMFRKQYYLEEFLPALLKKPLGATLTDARPRLIEVLNREGKIPQDLYAAYKAQNQLKQD